MIYTDADVTVKGKEDVEIKTVVTQNNIPILEQNFVEKMNGRNGFSNNRELQHIARVPYVAYLSAKQQGYNMDNEAEVNRFLRDNPEFLTCTDLHPVVGGNQHKIIIH